MTRRESTWKKKVVYDDELRLEAYRFEGIIQPFPSHFHEHYVIGFVEKGERVLSCRDREYAIEEGGILLFNPGDSHACVQSDGGTFDYRGTTFISTKVLLVGFRPVEILFFRFVMGFAALFLFDFEFGLERFADMTYLLNILYLSLGASAL